MEPSYTTILDTYVAHYRTWKSSTDCPRWLKDASDETIRDRAAMSLEYLATHGRHDPYGKMNPILTKTGKSLGLKTGKAFRLYIKSLPEFEAIAASEATVKTQPRPMNGGAA